MKKWIASKNVSGLCLVGLLWLSTNQQVLGQCSDLKITAQVKSASCGILNNGQITLQVRGGEEPYAYAWSNGAKSRSANGLSTGSYTVTVTDATGCTASLTETVDVQTKLQLTTDITPPTNAVTSDGVLKINADGGVRPYTFQITDYSDIQNIKRFSIQEYEISGLKAGKYAIDAIDANGCINTVMVVLGSQN